MRKLTMSIVTVAALLASPALVSAQNSGGTGGFPGFGTPDDGQANAEPSTPDAASSSDLPIQTVDDSPAMAGFPEGTELDILGIEPGMTPEEVRAAYTGRGEFGKLSMNEVFATNAENASEVCFQYPGQFEAPYPMNLHGGIRPGVSPGTNLVTVWFGSEAIGGRAYRIIRRFVPARDEPISVEAYKKQIIEKYGEPSGADDFFGTMAWEYTEAGQSKLPGWPFGANQNLSKATYNDRNNDNRTMDVPPCYFSLSEWIQQAGLYPAYKYLLTRKYLYRECNGGLYVQLRGDKRLESASFIAVDHQRVLANADELDRVINEKLRTETGVVSGPRL